MSAALAPPGYTSSEQESQRSPAPVPTSLAAFAAGLGSTLLFAFHELCLALPQAYSFSGTSNTLGTVLTLMATLGGAFASRAVRQPAVHAPAALAGLSLLSSAAGYAFYAAFSRGDALEITRRLVPCLAGAGIGFSAGVFVRAFGRGFAALGVLVHFLNPLRALLVAAAWLLLLFALPLLGLLRQAALLGGLLAGLAVLTSRVAVLFAIRAPLTWVGRALVGLAPFAALGALLGASSLVPLTEIRRHAGEIVYALDGPRGQHIVTKLQGGLVLFSNQVVATTNVDATRFAEALVHPALAIAEARDSVLVLDDAAGAVEREILRWPDVTQATLVPSDPALYRLARASRAFRDLGADALDSSRLRVHATEPSVFVLQARERYPIIIANLSDPISYLESKYYTVRFFEAVRERLRPGGIFALQITSPERTPRTHASILATLRRAGFTALAYRAPLPTLGEWGFAIAMAAPTARGETARGEAARGETARGEAARGEAARGEAARGEAANAALSQQKLEERKLEERVRAVRFVPAGTSLVTRETLAALFQLPGYAPAPVEAPNFLYEQALLELYHDEEEKRSE